MSKLFRDENGKYMGIWWWIKQSIAKRIQKRRDRYNSELELKRPEFSKYTSGPFAWPAGSTQKYRSRSYSRSASYSHSTSPSQSASPSSSPSPSPSPSPEIPEESESNELQ